MRHVQLLESGDTGIAVPDELATVDTEDAAGIAAWRSAHYRLFAERAGWPTTMNCPNGGGHDRLASALLDMTVHHPTFWRE